MSYDTLLMPHRNTVTCSPMFDGDSEYENRNYIDLLDLLKQSRTTSSCRHTHVLVGPPFGTFMIGGNKMRQFWINYADAVSKNSGPLYVAESPGKEAPILVDVDLKTKTESVVDALYSIDHVKTVVKAYQTVLTKIIADLRPEALTCVLLEKPAYTQTINGIAYTKNGFHLHFPKLFLDRTVQEIYLIPLVKLEIASLFQNIGIVDCIDANSVNVHWLMYGSKKPNNDPYLATRCFVADCVETSIVDGLKDYKAANFKNEHIAIDETNVMSHLPRIMSIYLYGRETDYYYKPKRSVNTPIMESLSNRKIDRTKYAQMTVSEALTEANLYMPMLSRKRADDRSDWLAVGFCIWNISEGDDEGLSMWLEFSEQSEKFDEVECIHLWTNMRTNQYTIGTLKFFAKQDSPEEYEELMNDRRRTLTTKMVKGSHNDIAQMLYNEYGNEFVCANVNSNTWYQFKHHMWHESEKGLDLRERVSASSGCIVKMLFDKLNELKSTVVDDSKKKKIDTIKAVLKQCKSAPFKNNVMSECVEVFRNSSFLPLLNKDPYLIAFKNGVYDFTSDTFRAGKPEDYLSVSLPMEYFDFGTTEHPRIMEIDDFFLKIFPDSAIREYFLYQISHLFIGGNHNKIMMFWTGNGNNGKTVTQTLFEHMLGPLAVKFSSSLITGKKAQLGVAAPELSRAGNGVRWAVMDEPNQDELINAGTLKALTGNDSYWARDLFEKGKSTKEIKPLFKLHMICNKLPGIRYADEATWDRIKVIPFESKFIPVDKCSSNLDEQIETKTFPKDSKLTDRLATMTQPLAWFLINKWRKNSDYKPVEPDKVRVATSAFRQDNDVYRQFVSENVIDKSDCKLTLGSLYTRYNDWFKIACPGHAMQPRTVIREQFVTIFGNLVGGKYWEGIAFDDDIRSSCKYSSGDRSIDRINPML